MLLQRCVDLRYGTEIIWLICFFVAVFCLWTVFTFYVVHCLSLLFLVVVLTQVLPADANELRVTANCQLGNSKAS